MSDPKTINDIFSRGRLTVSGNGRFLAWQDGAPFFWLGDTAWELFHRLSLDEADFYLENRRKKSFTVIQAVVLAELDGLNTPNARGDKPMVDNDPLKPNEAYFRHVDEIIRLAGSKGLFIGLLPTWGDKIDLQDHGIGPVIFQPRNAFQYGKWIAGRYRDFPNVIWINGGDRSGADRNFAVWDALARGVKSVDSNHLMTFHPPGGGGIGYSSSRWFHRCDWLDFNMTQSGHEYRDLPNYRLIEDDCALDPTKPCMDAEPRYEDHCVNWDPVQGRFDDSDVRQAAYWSLFAGAFGFTYGCHSVWQFLGPGRDPVGHARGYWKDALDLPGAFQMAHLRGLLESRSASDRIPDMSLLKQPGSGRDRAMACRVRDSAFVYLPTGKPTTIHLGKLAGRKIKASWFNPRDGRTGEIGVFDNVGQRAFSPPVSERVNDWVLVIDGFSCGS
jgi:hypothetical protein